MNQPKENGAVYPSPAVPVLPTNELSDASFAPNGAAVLDDAETRGNALAPLPTTPVAPPAFPALAEPGNALGGGAQWARIPAELRQRPQWLLASPDAKGALKVPTTVDANGKTRPSNTDRSTWLSFEVACKETAARGWGIGYCIGDDDPFACIDLDVKDKDNAPDKPETWSTQSQLDRFWRVVQAFDSYTEFSQSGKGLHIWVKGKVGKGRQRDGIEIYSQTRFIACTGRPLLNKPIADRQHWLTVLHAERNRGDQPHVELETVASDDTDYSIASHAIDRDGNPKDNEMGRLFIGDWQGRYPSQSEADLALVKMFARLTKSNSACWGAFLLSKLGQRDKAERADYRRMTLSMARTHLANDELAIAHGRQLAEALFWPPLIVTMPPPSALPTTQWESAFSPHFKILLDEDLMRLPQAQWFVKGIVPAAGVGSIYGPSGTFKSFLTLDLLASISNGVWWFGCRTVARPVVYVPFEGKSGVPNRIRAWRATRPPNTTSNIAFIYDNLNLRNPMDRDKLVKTLIEGGWAGGVLCIDTLAQSGPGIDENSSEGMGEMIAIFNELQAKLGGVVLVVHHTGKDASRGLRGWSGLLGALDFAIECEELSDKEKAHAKLTGKLAGKFSLAKVKDGEAGRTFEFEMLRVSLYDDEDGDDVTSLAVQPKARPKPAPSPEAAAINAADDDFIWQWANKMQNQGKRPSERALKAEREVMKTQRAMTEKRIAEAVARLRAAGRFVVEQTGKGNPWLRAIEPTTSTQVATSLPKQDA